MAPAPMEEADALYDLPPEEFVGARTALAKSLRSEGRRDDAAAVAKLRRPSVVAWSLNQVARRTPALVEAAIAAGADLRAATERAVAGEAGALRAATAAERAAASAVVKAAAGHLGGRSDALAPALLATIRVAALDDDVADQLRRGVLTTEQAQPGFGFGEDLDVAAWVPAAPRSAPRAKPATSRRSEPKPKAKATAKVPLTEGAAADDKVARAAAREAERVRTKELAARRRTADRKQREAARLAREADEADADARRARAAADEARAAAARAEQAVAELAGDD